MNHKETPRRQGQCLQQTMDKEQNTRVQMVKTRNLLNFQVLDFQVLKLLLSNSFSDRNPFLLYALLEVR